jgi:hypothetical protein
MSPMSPVPIYAYIRGRVRVYVDMGSTDIGDMEVNKHRLKTGLI